MRHFERSMNVSTVFDIKFVNSNASIPSILHNESDLFSNHLGSGTDEAGPSGINDHVEPEENADKIENDADSNQVHFPNDGQPGHLDNVR